MKKRAFALLIALSMVVSTLPMPVHAEEGAHYCGKTAHTHADSCYSTVKICEADEHQHGEGCFESQQKLLCTLPETHEHGEGCKDAEGNLTCPYEETHTHGDGCYTLSQQQICQIQVHTHDAAQCFSQTPACTLEVHSHDETCLVDPNASAPVPDEEPQAETPTCTCETACAAKTMNADCAVCGVEGATVEECDQYVAPTGDNPTEGSDATCTTHDWAAEMKQKDATQHYTQVCKICGTRNEESVVAHTIKYNYTKYYNNSQHKEYCTDCDYSITEACNYASDCEENCSECNLTTRLFYWEEHTLIYTTYIDGDDDSSNDSHKVRCANCSSLNNAAELCYYAFACSETCVCGRANPNLAAHTEQLTNESDGTHDKFCTVCKKLLADNEACVYLDTVDNAYLASPATCVSGTTYYKSCACGHVSDETFAVGALDSATHAGTNDKLVPNGVLHHNVVWSCCKAVVTENITCTASNADGSCSTAETCACGNLLIAAKDNHKLTYTASGNVITETCGWTGCEHTATATLHAPENPVYDGTQKLATVTYGDGWAGYSFDMISYSGTANDGSSYAGILYPAVKAGTVTASITAQSEDYTVATANVEYTIQKATPDVGTVSVERPATLYPHTKVTDIQLKSSGALPGALALNPGQALTVGTQEYDWTFTPNDTANYSNATGTVKLTVVKDTLQSIAITTPPTKTEYTYGEAFDTSGLVVTATFASGLTPDVTADVVCGPLNAGDTSITLSYTADSVTKTCTLENITVKKAVQAALTLTGIPATFTYGDVFTLGTSGGSSEEAVVWSMAPAGTASEVDASSGQVRIRDITPFTITAAKPGGKNYEDATATLTITPEKAMLYVTPDSYEIYEGDPMPGLTYVVTGLVNGDTYSNPRLTTVKTSAEDTFDILIEEGSGTLTNAAYYQVNYTAGKLTVRAHQWASQWSNDAGYHWHECGEEDCPITQNSGKYGYGAHVKDSNGLCQDCGYILEVKQLKTQIKTSAVTVSPGLNGTAFNTIPKIEAELTRVLTSSTGYSANNVATHDVTLQYSTDGGKTWVTATEENFPVEGITVVLPYPAGTGRNSHNFKVTHMFTVTSDKLRTTAGDTEQPAVTKLDSGIQVTLRGLSPVGISWKAIPTSGESQDSGSDKVYDSDSPKTGDITQTGLWFSLAVFSLVGLAGSLAAKKHRRKR